MAPLRPVGGLRPLHLESELCCLPSAQVTSTVTSTNLVLCTNGLPSGLGVDATGCDQLCLGVFAYLVESMKSKAEVQRTALHRNLHGTLGGWTC